MPSAAHARTQGSEDEKEHEKATPPEQSASEMTGSFHLEHPGEEESESGQEAAEGCQVPEGAVARGLGGRLPGPGGAVSLFAPGWGRGGPGFMR